MARYKNIRRTASLRHAVKFWWNVVKNYDGRVYDQDFFDIVAYNLRRDEAAAIIKGNFSEKELKPLEASKEETLELGWTLLSLLPKSALDRVDDTVLNAHYNPEAAQALVRKVSERNG